MTTPYRTSCTHMGNEISIWLNAFNLKSPLDFRTQRPNTTYENILFFFPLPDLTFSSPHCWAEAPPEKDKRWSLFKYTICKRRWHGRPQRLSHEEDTLVNNSGLITVKTHHQMYFIMLYGCHSLTFIYHFLVVGQWNAGFEIKSAMIHVSAVSVLH